GRGLRVRAQLRTSRIPRRGHLRDLRAFAKNGRRDQPATARRAYGFRAIAGPYFERTVAGGRRVARLGTLGFDAEYWRLVSAKRGSGSLPNAHGRGADRSESEPDPLLLMRRLQRIRRARHRAFPRSRHRRATST